MSRVRALSVTEPGPPESLRLIDVEGPRPRPQEITINVTASGIGFIDTLFRAGRFPFPAPFVPGIEVAGHVAELGDGVDPSLQLTSGTPVCALLNDFGRGSEAGGYAEVVRARADLVVPLDTATDLVRAAGAAVNGTTAWWALHESAHAAPGETVVVLGATGGLGDATLRLAAAAGLTTIAAAGDPGAAHDGLIHAGANHVVGRGTLPDDVRKVAPDGVDVVVDPVGGSARAAAIELLREFGRLVVVGNASGDDPPLSGDALWLGTRTVTGLSVGGIAHLRPTAIRRAARESLRVLVNESVPAPAEVAPDDVAKVHAALESGTAPVKTVIRWK